IKRRRSTQKHAVRRYINNLGRKYDLTPANWVRLLLYKRYRFSVCGRTREDLGQDFVVDPDHETGSVRGLLCRSCNQALGLFRDRVVVLEAAIVYLKNPVANRVLNDL